MRKVFLTGFPGFIGTGLVRDLLKKDESLEIIALVQQKFLHAAEAARARVSQEISGASRHLQFVFGDITAENLGIADHASISQETGAILHLAAAYDLALPREAGMRINVEGTRNVVEFAKHCRHLERFDYVSTAYVSGDVKGTFRETDFDRGQGFKNFYEETKFLAERIVREATDVPSVIYRPGVVVGHSKTGETAKYDGPYYVLQAMRSLPNHFPFPNIGKGDVEVNLVPIDFVVSAMSALFTDRSSIGLTFHLTDPAAMKVAELQRLLAGALGKKFISYPLPSAIARAAMKINLVRRIYKMPLQLVEYFVHDVHYDSAVAREALQKFGISCPRFTEYFQAMVGFFQSHKQEELQGILI